MTSKGKGRTGNKSSMTVALELERFGDPFKDASDALVWILACLNRNTNHVVATGSVVDQGDSGQPMDLVDKLVRKLSELGAMKSLETKLYVAELRLAMAKMSPKGASQVDFLDTERTRLLIEICDRAGVELLDDHTFSWRCGDKHGPAEGSSFDNIAEAAKDAIAKLKIDPDKMSED